VTPSQRAALDEVLEQSRSLGHLGPGSLRVQVEHALGFAAGLERAPQQFLDLGSGGGVPGLVLALHWPQCTAALLDSSARRCALLVEAVEALGCGHRVEVVRARAEEAGRRAGLRGRFELVVSRGFGPPPVTAECGAPFLRVGGHLVVSEPPADDGPAASTGSPGPGRWSAAGLAMLGLEDAAAWSEPYHYRSFVLGRPCPERYPRRVGVPAKRPLF
jgi:16S rRNA (guanine527-N7)-methyltransferase